MKDSLMKSPYLLAIISGLLIGTSYIPFPPWAIFFCFVPLWLAWISSHSLKRVFWLGWVTQFTLTLIGFNWVSYTVHEFGHLPWWASILTLFGFCSISTLSIPLAGITWWWFARQFRLGERARAWALPVFMSVGERTFPMIFDWHLGYTWLWAKFPGYHLADVIGFSGLSTIGLFANAAVLLTYLRWGRGRPWMRHAIAIPAVLIALNVLGWWHGRHLNPPDANLRVLIVQANIENEEKLAAEQGAAFRDVVLDRFATLTSEGLRTAAGPVDFAIWPETAFPDFILDRGLNGPYPTKLRALVRGFGVSLITGGYARNDGTGRAANAFFLLDPDGRWLSEPYRKTMLLAFGEYFPGADLFPRLRQWFPEVGDFERGPGPTVLTAGDVRIGAQICYEGLFDWFSSGLARKGAEVIVNLTNDSWYGTWEEPYQHLYMTLARAVETRRPLIRSTNTGISTVALASGEVLTQSPMHVPWQRVYDVPYVRAAPTTPFTGYGYWLMPTLLAIFLVLLVVRARTC